MVTYLKHFALILALSLVVLTLVLTTVTRREPPHAQELPQGDSAPILLPVIPPFEEVGPSEESRTTRSQTTQQPKGAFHGLVPGQLPENPDVDKHLYGYSGPYYNIILLNDRVAVLKQSLYMWPGSNWKVSGLIRNQTHHDVHISNITVRLTGRRGGVIGTANVLPFVTELRPGEPAPFIIETTVPRDGVVRADWEVNFSPSQPAPKMFELTPYWVEPYGAKEPTIPYSLAGSIRNSSPVSASNVRVVAAWLDEKRRVIYVDDLSIGPSLASAPQPAITLQGEQTAKFSYENDDPLIAPILADCSLALWGIGE